jgi:hypothetical protein
VNNIYQYRLHSDEIKINQESLVKSLGYTQDKVPGEILRLISLEIKNIKDYCSIKGGYRIIGNITINPDKYRLIINTTVFDLKKIIISQIKESTAMAIFLCTIGSKMETISRNLIRSGDPLLGYLIDAIASEAVERSMDVIQDKLKAQMKKRGLHITNRFSPGYCGWQVSEQQKLFSLLPHEFCGIKLSSSSLMIPIKSVSGIIGIGKDVEILDYPCKACDVKDCIRRKYLEK